MANLIGARRRPSGHVDARRALSVRIEPGWSSLRTFSLAVMKWPLGPIVVAVAAAMFATAAQAQPQSIPAAQFARVDVPGTSALATAPASENLAGRGYSEREYTSAGARSNTRSPTRSRTRPHSRARIPT